MDHLKKVEGMVERIRAIRLERFGNDLDALATQLGIPEQTWLNYEMGVVMPAATMLHFLEICDVDPYWLLNGSKRQAKRPAPEA